MKSKRKTATVTLSAVVATMILVLSLISANSLSSANAQILPSTKTANNSLELDAEHISQSNSISVANEPNVKGLVILIPDKIGTNESSWPQTFLPANATIASGTTVVWLNADVNASHSISVKDSTGQTVFSSNGTIPYQNSTSFRFRQTGQYTFTDPSLNSISTPPNGTINVVKGIDGTVSTTGENATNGNTTTAGIGPTLGMFVIPTKRAEAFDPHMTRLGFTLLSKANITATTTSSEIGGTSATNTTATTDKNDGSVVLYVWSENILPNHTLEKRLASKVRAIEPMIYPGHITKQLP